MPHNAGTRSSAISRLLQIQTTSTSSERIGVSGSNILHKDTRLDQPMGSGRGRRPSHIHANPYCIGAKRHPNLPGTEHCITCQPPSPNAPQPSITDTSFKPIAVPKSSRTQNHPAAIPAVSDPSSTEPERRFCTRPEAYTDAYCHERCTVQESRRRNSAEIRAEHWSFTRRHPAKLLVHQRGKPRRLADGLGRKRQGVGPHWRQ